MIKIGWSPLYSHPLEEGHRFPMEKYDLIPQQLRYEGTITEDNLFTPSQPDDEILYWTHSPEYLKRLRQGEMTAREMRKIGFPWSERLIERETLIMGGTIEAACHALQHGVAFNIAGGTHHAYYDRGEGFCLLNDLAITANYLTRTGKAKKVLIIDLDVHQGNGTASLFEGRADVFTFSMHGRHNYPLHKERSHLDIELDDHTGDAEYLRQLSAALPELLNKVKPDFILYQGGVDVLATDKLGRMAMSREGCKQRDKMVLELAYRNGIPLTSATGGGYSTNIIDIVEAHCNLYRLALDMWG